MLASVQVNIFLKVCNFILVPLLVNGWTSIKVLFCWGREEEVGRGRREEEGRRETKEAEKEKQNIVDEAAVDGRRRAVGGGLQVAGSG